MIRDWWFPTAFGIYTAIWSLWMWWDILHSRFIWALVDFGILLGMFSIFVWGIIEITTIDPLRNRMRRVGDVLVEQIRENIERLED